MEFCVLLVYILLINLICVAAELSLRLVFIIEVQDVELGHQIGRSLKAVEESRPEITVDDYIVQLDRENEEESYRKICSALATGVSMIIDLSWSPWETAEDLSSRSGIPLVRTLLGSQQLAKAMNDYLETRNASDAAWLLESESDVDRTLYELLGRSNIRVWMHPGLTKDASRMLKKMRPEPSFYIIVGGSDFVIDTYKRAVKEKLVRRDYRWNLILTDYSESSLDVSQLILPVMILHTDPSECCKIFGRRDQCTCPVDSQRNQYILNALLQYIAETYFKLEPDLPLITTRLDCDNTQGGEMNSTRDRLFQQFAEDTELSNDTLFYWDDERYGLFLRSRFILSTFKPDSGLRTVASWSADEEFSLLPGLTLEPLRLFFRIGTAPAIPWTLPLLDPVSGQPMSNEDGEPLYEGYCIDLIEKLAEVMEFDYEIITPKSGTFGKKLPNGTWDGVVGDLMKGDTDIAVAALTMTAEREEVIDFVAPYFEQTGILIVIRKPIRKTSLFKFMTVLRTEVWLSIVAALVLTGFMIWLLDKYSPYSARNNPEAYPYPCREANEQAYRLMVSDQRRPWTPETPEESQVRCRPFKKEYAVFLKVCISYREFTLKESFWFALTSFTPQGGGEAPKALSGRTLVAAYWLFVVLMLATFTANLAAFLTVERMQTPVSSLEQLAKQSRINYTVVESSTTHQYFINMKFAEDTLYRVWKEITLNATSDQAQYRVWDYPIREQYGHILLAINASEPVPDAETGFRQVNEHVDADFAFIHDAAEIKYEVTRNCNLTEVGEVFAEQPYAIAVQQGSRLQEELTMALLDLQKERFFEHLTAKYWNESARQACPDADESEGITLESLGGVFIATLFGLGLSMITLAWEVFYYKRKERNKVQAIDANIEKAKPTMTKSKSTLEKKMAVGAAKLRKKNKKNVANISKVTIGDTFKPAIDTSTVNYIKVFPKSGFHH